MSTLTPVGNAWRAAALDAVTRYFTRRSDDPDGEDLPFGLEVDPEGYLDKVRSSSLFHGRDNQVLYFMMVKEDGKYV